MEQGIKSKVFRKYSEFHSAVLAECEQSNSLQELSRKLKSDPVFKELRSLARSELQGAFDQMSAAAGITKVPVYLPIRKKISTRGQAHTLDGSPKEIRIYAIEGSSKPYELWTPSDITCMPPAKMLECLMHEAAHILEADRHGVMSHDQRFVEAYETIERFIEKSPYSKIRDRSLRLFGAPRNSVATNVRNRSRRNALPKPSPAKVPSGSGCAGSVLILIAIVVGVTRLVG